MAARRNGSDLNLQKSCQVPGQKGHVWTWIQLLWVDIHDILAFIKNGLVCWHNASRNMDRISLLILQLRQRVTQLTQTCMNGKEIDSKHKKIGFGLCLWHEWDESCYKACADSWIDQHGNLLRLTSVWRMTNTFCAMSVTSQVCSGSVSSTNEVAANLATLLQVYNLCVHLTTQVLTPFAAF